MYRKVLLGIALSIAGATYAQEDEIKRGLPVPGTYKPVVCIQCGSLGQWEPESRRTGKKLKCDRVLYFEKEAKAS